MLPSLWRRFTSSGPVPADERALARYYRDEGLHAELELQDARDFVNPSGNERILYTARSYFAC
jgi:hypothetical protein